MPLSIFANKVQEKTQSPQVQSIVETERLGAQVAGNIQSQGEKLNGVEGKMDTIESSVGNALKDLEEINRNQNSFGFSSLFSFLESKSTPATDSSSTSAQSSTVTDDSGPGSEKVQEKSSALKRIGSALDPVIGLLNSDSLNSVKRMMKIGDTNAKDEEEKAQIEASVGTIQNMAIDTRTSVAEQNERMDGLDAQVDASSDRIRSATSRVEKLLKK